MKNTVAKAGFFKPATKQYWLEKNKQELTAYTNIMVALIAYIKKNINKIEYENRIYNIYLDDCELHILLNITNGIEYKIKMSGLINEKILFILTRVKSKYHKEAKLSCASYRKTEFDQLITDLNKEINNDIKSLEQSKKLKK